MLSLEWGICCCSDRSWSIHGEKTLGSWLAAKLGSRLVIIIMARTISIGALLGGVIGVAVGAL